MFAAVLVIHITACVFLVLVVLLQSGRGAELGAAFGSVGQAQFGRGRATFLSKFTTGLAVVFMVTSLSLAFMSSEAPRQSILAPTGSEAPAVPAASTPLTGRPGAGEPGTESVTPAEPAGASNAPAGLPAPAGQSGPLQPTDAPPQEKKE
jgi:preprotein translocase subunit SecG